MFRYLTTRGNPVAAPIGAEIDRVTRVVRAAGLVVVVLTVSLASPGPASGGAHGTAIAVTLGLCVTAWVVWILAGNRYPVMVGSLVVMGGAGGVLAGLSPNSAAAGVGCVAVFSAGVRLRIGLSLGILAETLAAFLITGCWPGPRRWPCSVIRGPSSGCGPCP